MIYNERTPNDPSCKGARLSLSFVNAFPQVIKAITEKVPLFRPNGSSLPLFRWPLLAGVRFPYVDQTQILARFPEKSSGKAKETARKANGSRRKAAPQRKTEAKSQKRSTGDIGHKSTGSGDRPSESAPAPQQQKKLASPTARQPLNQAPSNPSPSQLEHRAKGKAR